MDDELFRIARLVEISNSLRHGPRLGSFAGVDPASRARGQARGASPGGRAKRNRGRQPGFQPAVQLAKSAGSLRGRQIGPQAIDKSKWDDRLRELDRLCAEQARGGES